jgi:hypothetical protein
MAAPKTEAYDDKPKEQLPKPVGLEIHWLDSLLAWHWSVYHGWFGSGNETGQ